MQPVQLCYMSVSQEHGVPRQQLSKQSILQDRHLDEDHFVAPDKFT